MHPWTCTLFRHNVGWLLHLVLQLSLLELELRTLYLLLPLLHLLAC